MRASLSAGHQAQHDALAKALEPYHEHLKRKFSSRRPIVMAAAAELERTPGVSRAAVDFLFGQQPGGR